MGRGGEEWGEVGRGEEEWGGGVLVVMNFSLVLSKTYDSVIKSY